jgi:xylulokinase
MDHYLIGFDLGTSAIKAVLADTDGAIVASASRAVELERPRTHWCEFDAERYFDLVTAILGELASSTPPGGKVAAMSFCAASGNTILLDEHYRPVRKVVSWLDERAKHDLPESVEKLDDAGVRSRVGWGWNGGFPLAHLAWLAAREPESWNRTHRFAMNNDYLYYRLCRRLVVDPSKATTFYLRNQVTGEWNRDYLELLGIDEASLPEVVASGTAVGTLLPEVAASTGLSPQTAIVTGSFDHPGAARSTGVFDPGDLLISAGTSWVAFAPIRDRGIGIEHEMLVDPFLSPAGPWGAMFALTAVANRVDAILERLLPSEPERYRRFDELATDTAPGAGGLIIDPWKQSVDEIVAAASGHGEAAVLRAVMEGCVYLMKHRIERLEVINGGRLGRIVMVGGPTKSPIWPQILADVLGYPLHLPATGAHAGALGAAMLAGIGTAAYRDERDAFSRAGGSERVIVPDPTTGALYRDSYRRFVERFVG